MSLFHRAVRTCIRAPVLIQLTQTRAVIPLRYSRTYAKATKAKSTADFVPGSKQPLTDAAAIAEYERATQKMSQVVDYFRRECSAYELRASGRVTPKVLDDVRVELGKTKVRLEEVATVGVRDGSMLLVTAFDESTLKSIEAGIYLAKIPGVVPQKHDARTIKIPIPKPTVDSRAALYKDAHREAESCRVQIRKQHQASVKRGKYEKRSVELEEFQKLLDRFIGDIDKTLEQLQKVTGRSR